MGPSGEGQTQTFISCHSAIVNKYPNVEAIVSMQQPAGLYDLGDKTGRYLRVTYRQLYDKSRLMSRYLTKIHALPPATPMFLFLSTGVELYLSTVAGHHAGFYVVPIAPSTLVNSGEAIHMMHTVIEELNAESAIVVVDDHGLARRFDAIVASSEEINVSWMRIIVDGHPLQWRNFAELLIGNVSPSTDEPCEAGTKVIMFTSGTTTRPKAVIFKMDEMADLSRYSVMGPLSDSGRQDDHESAGKSQLLIHLFSNYLDARSHDGFTK
ncbi:AMP-dependent synthetase/ligase [Ascosphaera apis ARSEF 7405]|uniref:medium-chain acyl-CoA ligase n=1 Tax=Ascosphaera apis ARSEF 7405 TaxID=392613 RepID=A0A168BR66_9EURO|nr:AMP-dependent synthetase/ligase [Ascosphaera apis ARSEF 7405]